MAMNVGISENSTVLIVDADRCIRIMLAEILREAGYLALAAADAEEAVAIIAGERISVVVADGGLATPAGRRLVRALAMAGRAGSATAAETDRAERSVGAEVPVVLLSSSGHVVKASDLSGLGVQMILSKPLSRRELLAGVAEILGAADAERGAAA